MLRIAAIGACLALAASASAGSTASCEKLDSGDRTIELRLDGTEINLEGETLVLNASGSELVRIDAARQLTVAGRTIAVPRESRADLDAYVAGFRQLQTDAKQIGADGGRIAAKAIAGLASVMFTSATMEDFEREMEAQGARIEAKADDLCRTIAALQRTELALQQRIPAFPNVISTSNPAL